MIQNSLEVGSEIWVNTLYTLASIGVATSVILSLVWTFRVNSWSLGAGIAIITVYSISNGIGFGSLFLIFHMKEIMLIFGIVGFILLGTYVAAKCSTLKGMLTLTKVISFIFIFYMLALLIVFLSTFFTLGGSSQIFGLYMMVSGVGGLLSCLYLVYEFWMIQRLDDFIEDQEIKKKNAVFFGFLILTNLISLVWTIARMVLISRD